MSGVEQIIVQITTVMAEDKLYGGFVNKDEAMEFVTQCRSMFRSQSRCP
jgi:hypothetical protein